jgi:hypothetical protein
MKEFQVSSINSYMMLETSPFRSSEYRQFAFWSQVLVLFLSGRAHLYKL